MTTRTREDSLHFRRFSTSEELHAAIASARSTTASWRRTAPATRAAALREAARAVRSRADALGDLLCATTGRLLGEARGSAEVAADLLDEAAVTVLTGAGRLLAGAPGGLDTVRAEPRGVVAVLTPWNDPYPATAGLIAAAVGVGNTVLHKPSERSAEPGAELARLVAGCLPPGVLEVVHGGGEVGEQVVADGRVDVVAHVGSTATGRRIAAVVGARGGKVLLENGGKDPLVVDAGVDPGWAAEQIAVGAVTNAGQLCTAVERVYVHADVAEPVVAALVQQARARRPGDPRDPRTTLGPLVDEQQLAVVERQVVQALDVGARCLAGGSRLAELADVGTGCWYPATVLVDCTDDMAVMTEETFGPVAPVAVVPSFAEGLRRAAASSYGLAATVLTPSMQHALQAVEELDVGTVKVNAVFGGAPGGSADPRRGSGNGRGYGPDLLGELTALKAEHLEPAPRARPT
jgi:succinate-semialdehyde dehydrogenase/glutarate-semialdehyde dehydrogenase